MGGSAIGILVALLAPAELAVAADQTVTASDDPVNAFSPAAVTVQPGDTVTWKNVSGTHSVDFNDRSFTEPEFPEPAPWTVSRTFGSLGSFRYYCDAHPEQMVGTVTVQGGGPAPPGTDKVAPSVKLSGKRSQAVLRRRAVVVTVAVNEAATVSAKGNVSVPGAAKVFRLKRATRKLAAGAKAQLRLKLTKQAQRAFRRALARRVKLTARLTVTAKDAAGNTRSAKRKVRLKQ
jgi:plastocyanin